MADPKPFIVGSQGQYVVNKLFREADNPEKMALSLERASMLTALERSKKNLQREPEEESLEDLLAG